MFTVDGVDVPQGADGRPLVPTEVWAILVALAAEVAAVRAANAALAAEVRALNARLGRRELSLLASRRPPTLPRGHDRRPHSLAIP
jgi:hypothetical protein